ncbi:anti-sigma factor [Bacillus sp. ISL-47]|uniref:anti-sigma factor family protein n=1 Tax=Bacillus sp. ISL-47 TaxID=2819130 RepID=UPI001BE8E8B6|nr:anti-sigma factor [Bacillus sp. ISL-47]MBT2687665.1 anti-sigma factor [Bacillus sp. ISL-47]MBT2707460.1 anti-sigma factor [Pseudomonas sp. ISL-84]
MKCPAEIVLFMHEYLDEEISAEHEKELRAHLQSCEECQNHFHELKKTIALVQSTSHIQAPDNFTANVMAKLPKEKRKVGVQRWFRQHPLLTAASLFLVLMMGSLISSWDQDHQLSVSKQPNLVVQNDKVIVPEGEVVKGDVVVKNGNLEIQGQVEGNVTVINGEQYMASAGKVTGEIEEVNAIFEWIWYHIKKASKEIVSVFDNDEAEKEK